MGGFSDFMFGDDGGYEGSVPTRTPEEMRLVKWIAGQSKRAIQDNVFDVYDGQRVAGLSPMQNSTFDAIGQAVGGGNAAYSSGLSALQQIINGGVAPTAQAINAPGAVGPNMGMAAGLPGAASVKTSGLGATTAAPYSVAGPAGVQGPSVGSYDPSAAMAMFNQNVKNPALKTWEQDILPQIQEKFISNNAGSSGAANRAIARSGADLNADLSGQLSNLLYQDKNDYLGRKFTADEAFRDRSLAAGESFAGRSDAANAMASELGFSGAESAQTRTLQAALADAGYSDANAGRQFDAAQFLEGLQVSGRESAAARSYDANKTYEGNRLTQGNVQLEALFNAAPELRSYFESATDRGFAAGDAERAATQQGLDAQRAKWDESQIYNNPWYKQAGMILGTPSSVESVVRQPSKGVLGDILATGANAYLSK